MLKEIVASLKVGEEAQLAKAEEVKEELKGKLVALDQILVDHEIELKAAKDAGFEEGLAQAEQAGGSDKIYSDAEMNAERAPLLEKIAGLEGALALAEDHKAALSDEIVTLQEEKVELSVSNQNLGEFLLAKSTKLEAAESELAALKGDLQSKVNEFFAVKMTEVLAKIDEMELKEQSDVEKTKEIRSALAELVAPAV